MPVVKHIKKPEWLKINLGGGKDYADIKEKISRFKLNTVCDSAACPNRGECWNARTLTIMILGEICTRGCRFCNVKRGVPLPPDPEEPKRVAEMIASIGLKHAVLTCVTRDDLDDGGAAHWVETIKAIKKSAPQTSIEVLVSDFNGNLNAQKAVFKAAPDVLAHNIETVESLHASVRVNAVYERTLELLAHAYEANMLTKSGLMLGLGEREDEVLQTLKKLADTNVSIVTIGQYLQPTSKHLPVVDYITPEKFNEYKLKGEQLGIKKVISGPLVRSSYMAHTYIDVLKNNRKWTPFCL